MNEEQWKEKLMDEFCVMFERAARESDSENFWVEKLEAFIRQTLASQMKAKVEAAVNIIENYKEHSSHNPNDKCIHEMLDKVRSLQPEISSEENTPHKQ